MGWTGPSNPRRSWPRLSTAAIDGAGHPAAALEAYLAGRHTGPLFPSEPGGGWRPAAETSRRMWDMSDLLINTAGAPHPLAQAVPERADDHDEICAALGARDAAAARSTMERHILATVPIIYRPHRFSRCRPVTPAPAGPSLL